MLNFTGRLLAPFIAVWAISILTTPIPATADTVLECSTISGSGTWVNEGNLSMVYSAIQPVPVCVSVHDTLEHHSGFLTGIAIQPQTVNSEGIPVELTSDNDIDGLSDVDEITGDAFSGYAQTDPNLADTDGDGMDDGQEAQYMYDPLDPAHRPWINFIAFNEPQMSLEWIGRGGNTTNTIMWSDILAPGVFTNELVITNLMDGTSPWYKTTNVYEWSWAGEGRRYYRLKL